MYDITYRIVDTEKILALFQITTDSKHTDSDDIQDHNEAKQLQEQIKQKNLGAECFLTDRIGEFGKNNKTTEMTSDTRSTMFEITGLPIPPQHFLVQRKSKLEEIKPACKQKLSKSTSGTIVPISTKSAD